MPAWLPSLPYRPQPSGYWSPVTSTINWCEEDYYATPYAAEIVNTFTNLLFMGLAFKGVRNCLTQGHDPIFTITFLGYLVVGTGSFAFHATLKYPMQLVDELSMIYTTCLMCHATFSYSRGIAFKWVLAVGLLSLALFISLYYHYLQDPLFHQNAYALLTAVVLIRSMYMMEVNIRPSLRKKQAEVQRIEQEGQNGFTSPEEKAEKLRQDKRDIKILNTMWTMVAYGLAVFLGGFFIWNLDNWYCGTIRRWRHEVGLPWGIVLEGHGWWHLMTGTGAYFYITWGIWLRQCLDGKQDEYYLRWPRLVTSLPVVLKVENKTKTEMNGKKVQ